MTRIEKAKPDKAILYRMVLPDHVCPFGVRAKELLEAHHFDFEDGILSSRQEVDAFEAKQRVTPPRNSSSRESGSAAAMIWKNTLADR